MKRKDLELFKQMPKEENLYFETMEDWQNYIDKQEEYKNIDKEK